MHEEGTENGRQGRRVTETNIISMHKMHKETLLLSKQGRAPQADVEHVDGAGESKSELGDSTWSSAYLRSPGVGLGLTKWLDQGLTA